jgi:hypothetical protein
MQEHRRKLEARADEIRRRLEAGSLRPEEANALQVEQTLIELQLQQISLPQTVPGPERDQIQRKLEELKAAMRHALEAGKPEEVERLKRVAGDISRSLRERAAQAGPPGQPSGGPGPDQERLRQRLESIKQQVELLEKEGKYEEAERLKREAEAMMRKMRERGWEPGPAGPLPPEEVERRLHHLKVAVENLRAAGFQQQADALMQLAGRLEGESRRGPGRPEGPPAGGRQPADARARPEGGTPTGPLPSPEAGHRRSPDVAGPDPVQQLRGEVNEMRREMQELRDQLKRMLDQPRQGLR